jgi:hypothetical protein
LNKDPKKRNLGPNGDPNEEPIISEKWVVALLSNSINHKWMLKEFYARDYYEAFDIIMTYTEKTNAEVLWFKEKRNLGYPDSNINFPQLEHFCTYCNNRFSKIELIPCVRDMCNSNFCSKKCLENHLYLHRQDHN